MTRLVSKMAVPVVCAAVVVSVSACADGRNGVAHQRGSQGNRPAQESPTEIIPASDLPPPEEPQLADPSNWAADFNDAQIRCYQGSMSACDSIWLSDRVLIDSWLDDYGFLCGGRIRVEQGSARLARTREFDHMRCIEIFPGHD